jgi:SAM domain (Sterile alpha motif)
MADTARPSGPPEGCLCDLGRQLLDRRAEIGSGRDDLACNPKPTGNPPASFRVPAAQYSLDSSVRLREISLDSTTTPQMDVSTWLRDLGLGNYVQAFQAHDIDAEVLPRLTADDLTALGITSVGHRRRLLDAIAALDRGTAPGAEPIAIAARPPEAERGS